MFGKRQRRAQLEAIERALAADAEAREALVDALNHIDVRLERGLEEHARLQLETDATVQHLRSTSVETKADLAHAVEHLAMVCSMLSERIEDDRRERQLLVASIADLVERQRGDALTSPRVVGGSVYATPGAAIDVTTDEERPSCWHRVGREDAMGTP
jgi:hypothetical protein